MAKETKVAVREDSELVPDYLQKFSGGTDDMDISPDDVKPSRLSLKSKPKVDEDTGDTLYRPGEFYDHVLGRSMGKSLDVIILEMRKEWVRFKKDTQIVEATSSDGESWIVKDSNEIVPFQGKEKTECLQFVFTCLHSDGVERYPFYFSSKGYGNYLNIQKLLGEFVRMNEKTGRRICSYVWRLSGKKNEKSDYDAYVTKYELVGDISKEQSDRVEDAMARIERSKEKKSYDALEDIDQ